MTVEPTLTLAEVARRPWEALVVGAGPAGALAARELARLGRAVLLVDRAAFPRWKVCGCCLNVRALATLTAVGLGDLPARHAAVPLRSVLVAAPGCQARLPLPGGAALSREAFDAALVRAAIAAGAAFLPQTRAALGPVVSSGRIVSLTGDGTTATVLAALVLAADGLGGRFLTGAAALTPTASSRVGAGTVADDAPAFFGPECVHMACGTGGYVGLVRLEDGRLDVAAAFDRDAVRRAGGPGEAALRIVREAGLPEVPGLAERPWRGTPPLTRTASLLARERVLVLGDAAGYVEPLTGEGMAWALVAAAAVAPLADRAARRWDPSIGRRWVTLHRRVVVGRQTTCRLAAAVLRHPRLTRAAVRLLGQLPGLAAPVIGRLNAAPAFPRGASP
jgi:flavin-dependent dehydrogenase